jgi:hypothetical protein
MEIQEGLCGGCSCFCIKEVGVHGKPTRLVVRCRPRYLSHSEVGMNRCMHATIGELSESVLSPF